MQIPGMIALRYGVTKLEDSMDDADRTNFEFFDHIWHILCHADTMRWKGAECVPVCAALKLPSFSRRQGHSRHSYLGIHFSTLETKKKSIGKWK